MSAIYCLEGGGNGGREGGGNLLFGGWWGGLMFPNQPAVTDASVPSV